MYHSISSSSGSRWAVSEKAFEEQIRLLVAEGWKTACVRDLFDAEGLPPRTVVLTFDDGYADNFEHGFNCLTRYGMKATWFVVSGDVGRRSSWSDDDNPSRSMLSSMQLREMAQAGMEIGAHTRTHPRLPGLDIEAIADEVTGSKKDLEDILGSEVTSFAYPYGLLNEDCVKAVKDAGFKAACTTRTGWFGSDPDMLRVRRVAVFSDDSLSTFARKLVFADNEVDWGRMTNYMASRVRARILG
ncbi:MAG: polysaccharide deacetylase family protein [Deltaproteobacteria bacterium]|nr:polysaccharide deacetylase family protein [Deltaproteobacteria bacterium]